MHHLEKAGNGLATEREFSSEFERDVYKGLSAHPKWLSSKYFYNEVGDRIFQEIMNMEEYYLTDAEMNIFKDQKDDIREAISGESQFRLIELGAGDGTKTKVLLDHFVRNQVNFSYHPVDISSHVLDLLEESLKKDIPGLNIQPRVGDYFNVLSELSIENDMRNVIFFLGSNIGNFSYEVALDFLKSIRSHLHKDDILIIGIDLKKDPSKILNAYNDEKGITKRFNLNLLDRINDEMGADFSKEKFKHYPVYDPISGECRSYLLSTEEQQVRIDSLDETFHFNKWEPIFMEVSTKYNPEEIAEIAGRCGFDNTMNFYENEIGFVDSLWTAI